MTFAEAVEMQGAKRAATICSVAPPEKALRRSIVMTHQRLLKRRLEGFVQAYEALYSSWARELAKEHPSILQLDPHMQAIEMAKRSRAKKRPGPLFRADEADGRSLSSQARGTH